MKMGKPGDFAAAIIDAIRDISPSDLLFEMLRLDPGTCTGERSSLQRRDALKAHGRRSREELRMPIPRNPSNFRYGRGHRNLHQCNRRCHRQNRRGRVHHDTDRTVVGIGRALMCVRNLRYREQSQKHHAHSCDHRKGTRPQAAIRCARMEQS